MRGFRDYVSKLDACFLQVPMAIVKLHLADGLHALRGANSEQDLRYGLGSEVILIQMKLFKRILFGEKLP